MEQRISVRGIAYAAGAADLQNALATVYEMPERPLCLCVRAGVPMYVAKHRQYLVKRMPETGHQHHPSCPCYEPEAGQSGLGALVGESIIEHAADSIELRVDFPLARMPGRPIARGEATEPGEVIAPRHEMSLRAVMHLLFERAGFNRWYPAMQGKRNQGVVHRYLMDAAGEMTTKGVRLSDRLYVPEPFSEGRKGELAERRRSKFALLHSPEDDVAFKMALVLGELKASESSVFGRRIWIKHMPDTPLSMDSKSWERVERIYGILLQAREVDPRLRLIMCALIYAKREHTYQIDTLNLMLTTEQWIPVEGIHEVDLVQALIDNKRRFLKPLRYDARSAALFPNALLLDTGDRPTPLHAVSPFMEGKERVLKEKTIKAQANSAWVWVMDKPMPPLPALA